MTDASKEKIKTFGEEVLKYISAVVVSFIGAYALILSSVINQIPILQDEITELRKEIEVLMEDKRKLEQIVANEFHVYVAWQKLFEDFQYPAWLKERQSDGRYLVVGINKKYEEEFSVSRYQYINRYDDDIWSKPVAEGYRLTDDVVYTIGKPVVTIEYVPVNGVEGGKLMPLWVVKWKVFLTNRRTGVAGMSMDLSKIVCDPETGIAILPDALSEASVEKIEE